MRFGFVQFPESLVGPPDGELDRRGYFRLIGQLCLRAAAGGFERFGDGGFAVAVWVRPQPGWIGKGEHVLQERVNARSLGRFFPRAIALRNHPLGLEHRDNDPTQDGEENDQRRGDSDLVPPNELLGAIGKGGIVAH